MIDQSSLWFISLFLVISLNLFVVNCQNSKEANRVSHQRRDLEALGLEYHSYLEEISRILEEDKLFKATIKLYDKDDIRYGKVASRIEYVEEKFRNELDLAKAVQLKNFFRNKMKEMEKKNGKKYKEDEFIQLKNPMGHLPKHLGSYEPRFGDSDLHRLMTNALMDLERIREERKVVYRTNRLEEESKFQERIASMNDLQKQDAIKQRQKMKEMHDRYSKVHEPGSQQHFEEIWVKKNKLRREDFDPKLFFELQDSYKDSSWDVDEVKELVAFDLGKLYGARNDSGNEPNDWDEENLRMRKHIHTKMDFDMDGLISEYEFLKYSKTPEFKIDHGWGYLSDKEFQRMFEIDSHSEL